jgi:Cysteine-rich secretory protein family
MLIDRRSFLITAPGLGLGLSALASAQGIVERGRFGEDDLPVVREQLLQMVNKERLAENVALLRLDDLACSVAQEHALDTARGKFLSHWGRDGRKPYHRYSFAGGTDAVQENVSAAEDIASITPPAIYRDLRDMHSSMSAEVAPNDGHRRAILAPQHTHVGFGVALNEYSLRLCELYVARYVRIDPVQRHALRRATVTLTGKLINANHFLHQVDVCYEPLSTPPALDWLRTPRSYSLPDDCLTLWPKTPKGTFYEDGTTGDYEWSRDGTFRVPVKLTKDKPGIYTIVFWLRTKPSEDPFPATGVCIVGD